MSGYPRRLVLALAVSFAAATPLTGHPALAAEPVPDPSADDIGINACTSIPSTADPNVIKTVYEVGLSLGVSDRVMLAAFEAGWVESHMNNLPCGDQDSLGVFQQRPSQGWGTPAQVMDVAYASHSFFIRAIPLAANNPGWSAGQVAQGVQRSAFPSRYDAAQATALALIEQARQLSAPFREFGLPGKQGVSYGQSTQFFGVSSDGSRSLVQRVFVPGEGWRGWADLGGSILGVPNVVLYGNQLQVWVRGIDNNVWQLTYAPGEGWRAWANLGGPVSSDPVVIVNDGNLNVFARGTDGSVVFRPYQPGHGWHPWASLGGNIIGMPAVVNYGHQCQVFVRGIDNNVWQLVYDGGWGAWTSIGGPTSTDVVPAVHGGNMNVFVRNYDGNVVYRAWEPGFGWHGWHNLGGNIIGKPEALDYGGYFQVFGRGTDNNLWQLAYTPGVGWHSWTGHGGGPLTGEPVGVIFNQYLNVFSRHSNSSLVYRGFDPNAGWQPWYNLGGSIR